VLSNPPEQIITIFTSFLQIYYRIPNRLQLNPYLARVISYKKGLEGILLTFDIGKAHKYRNEKNAQKPAQLYNGEVKLI